MKSNNHRIKLAFATCALLAALPAAAQESPFNSGSDGSDGPLHVTENTTLELPSDGVFHFTTITIDSGRTLKIGRNGRNTPVYMLASGDVVINGTIDVSGTNGTSSSGGFGGPGGWGGGSPGLANNPAGDGQGPGGGKVGTVGNISVWTGSSLMIGASGGGSHGSAPKQHAGSAHSGATYGSALLIPLMGGSGGAGSFDGGSFPSGGGGGGGAILVASNTKITISGNVLARGGSADSSWQPQQGSGGAIRVVAPEIAGTGSLWASGGGSSNGAEAGHGRIRLDCSIYSGNLSMPHAASSIGFNPVIFPPNPPTLRLKNVAGTEISPDNTSAIIVTLPADGNSLQPVTVEASNFLVGDVRFVVSVVPERGPTTFTEGVITNPAGATATRTVNVSFPLNASSQVYVWTKQMTAPTPSPLP